MTCKAATGTAAKQWSSRGSQTIVDEANQQIISALERALTFLLEQQRTDGGWHSTTYGQLKDGAGATALILSALAHLPLALKAKSERAWTRASGFLQRGLAKRGTIASPDGTLDFPTYAAALWLEAQRSRRDAAPSDESRKKVVEYLLAAQIAKPRGFEPDSPSYGGWDFLGADDARDVTTGTNISITAHVVEALAGARTLAERRIDAALTLAKAYVLRCQQADGGFAFTCEPASLNNKAAYSDEKLTQPRSYGTATCDGLRALLACGFKPIEEPVAKSLAWLARRPDLEVVPGFEGLAAEAGWERGLRFYYYARLAGVLEHLADGKVRRSALHKHVIALQKDDGSWQNESDRMRENDPLIATALVLTALAAAAH